MDQQKRARDIEQQIAYLRWKRMQNDREIKKSIVVSKAHRQKDSVLALSTDSAVKKNSWATSVVRDELQRPLVVSDEELFHLQSEEAKSKQKLQKVSVCRYFQYLFHGLLMKIQYSERHLNVIQNASNKLKSNQCHGEFQQRIQDEKLVLLRDLRDEAIATRRNVVHSLPMIDTKEAIPKLFS